jgi:hypothetical protein
MKPTVGANVVSPAVCVMTRAQRAGAERGKEESESDDNDNDEVSSSDSSEEPEDHQQREEISDEEKEDRLEQGEPVNDKENKERPIGANNDEWKADRRIHREVSKTIQEIQEEEGEALPTLEEFAPWYLEEKEAGKDTGRSPEEGGVPKTTHARVDKILENVMNHTRANISIGKLLEITPYCKKRVMVALTIQKETSERPTSTYQVTAKAFDEEMPMISLIMKNRRIPNALIDGGSRVNIITDTLKKKLGLKRMEPAPFTLKMAEQKKVMPKGIIRDVRLDVGGIVIQTTLTVIDMVSTEDSYSLLLGRPWLKEAQAQHDWPLNKLTLIQGENKVEISTQRTPALPPAKRPLHWENYDWGMGLTDGEETVVYEAFPELLPMGDFDLKSLKKLRGPSCNAVEVDPETSKTEKTSETESNQERARSNGRETGVSKPILQNERRGHRNRSHPCLRSGQREENSRMDRGG